MRCLIIFCVFLQSAFSIECPNVPRVCCNGEIPSCPNDNSCPTSRPHTCSDGLSVMCGNEQSFPPRTTCPDGSTDTNNNQNQGQGQNGANNSITCTAGVDLPCAASLLGDVARTSLSAAGYPLMENIYGPFENGFSSTQDTQLRAFGCDPPSLGYSDGGMDTNIVERIMAEECGVTLSRYEPNADSISENDWVGLLNSCGGHTNEFHFHENMSCLWSDVNGEHSAKIADAMDGKPLYGKYESYPEMPELDACGGHFGPTPDRETNVYHYHVQDAAPFSIGCFGPNADNSLVTVEQCRALYSGCADSGTDEEWTVNGEPIPYRRWCPCWDGEGKNAGTIVPRAVFTSSATTSAPVTTEAEVTSTEASTEAPTDPVTEASTEAPTDPVTEASTEAPTDPVTEASTEAPTDPVTEASTEAQTTDPVTEASTEAPTDPVTEASTEAPTDPVTEASTEAPTEPVTEAPVTSTWAWATQDGVCGLNGSVCEKPVTVTCEKTTGATTTTVDDSECTSNNAGTKPSSTDDCASSECPLYARSEMTFDGMTADQFTTHKVGITAEVANNLGKDADDVTLTLQTTRRRRMNDQLNVLCEVVVTSKSEADQLETTMVSDDFANALVSDIQNIDSSLSSVSVEVASYEADTTTTTEAPTTQPTVGDAPTTLPTVGGSGLDDSSLSLVCALSFLSILFVNF